MAVMLSDVLRNLTFNRSAHCTQVSDQCPLGLLFCHRPGRRDFTNSTTTDEVTPSTDDIKLGIVSYNCKNIIRSKHEISEIARDNDIIF